MDATEPPKSGTPTANSNAHSKRSAKWRLKVSFCDETNRVVAGDWHGNIRVWNAADGKRLGELAQNPPSLQQRLAAAQADLAAKQKDAAAKAAAAANAVKQRDNVNTALAANKKLLTDSTNLQNQAKQQVPALTKTLQTVKQQLVAATAAQASLAKAVPQLKTAADQVKAAAASVPADKELAALVASVQKKYTQKQAEYTAAQAMVKTKTAEQTQTTTKLAAMQKQMKDSAANMQKAQGQIKALTPQVKPKTDAANKAVAASTPPQPRTTRPRQPSPAGTTTSPSKANSPNSHRPKPS